MRSRHRFRSGDILHEKVTGKFFRVERLRTHFGMRYLLRSLESGNPGRPKSAAYLDLQIADGYYVRMTVAQYLDATE